MADFIFVSPSVKTKEIDLTPTTTTVGLTTAGLVGETVKGPAFQAIPISNKSQFRNLFGGKSVEKIGDNYKYILPHYADSYLSESNQLFVTRVLGLSGYVAGKAWGVKILASYDPTTIANGSSSTGSTTYVGTFSGVTIAASQVGVTSTISPSFVRSVDTFTGTEVKYIIGTAVSTVSGLTGTVTYTATTQTATPYTVYDKQVVATLRTRGSYSIDTLTYNTSGLTMTVGGAATSPFSTFTLTASGAVSNESYTVSIDPTSTSYLSKVLGSKPKDKATGLFVQTDYPDLINHLQYNNLIYGISSELVVLEDNVKVSFASSYRSAETPWIVSEIRGSVIDRLFKFITISDGDTANTEIKISIQNIAPETGEFDVVIRDFNDTDNNLIVLESFSKCNLDKSSTSFIGNRIGDNGNNYNNLSNYVYLEFDDLDNLPSDAFPAGFEGYNLRSFASGNTNGQVGLIPSMLFKTSYLATDKLSRTYLGISERAYDTSSNGTGINPSFFAYSGGLSASGTTKTKGFHLDSGATLTYVDGTYSIGEFYTGPDKFQTSVDTNNASNAYFSKATRKFTVAPYGGFDGWDIYRTSRTIANKYALGGSAYSATADYTAWTQAINTFDNPEETPINLIATPGINWADNLGLVDYTIDMVETRADVLYIADAPDLPNEADSATYANDISDLMLSTGIDSTYVCSYGPHCQIFDQDNNVNVYIAPTGMVLKSMAYTDNKSFPWFAPAGLTRGVTDVKKTRYKLKETDRDILYSVGINPLATNNQIVTIMGQKVLSPTASSLMSRINVRRLLLYLKRTISNISQQLLFEQNDDVVVQQFMDKVKPVFAAVKAERGINQFIVKLSDSNTPESRDRNELYFDMYIYPTSSVEFIGLSFIVTPNGAAFQGA